MELGLHVAVGDARSRIVRIRDEPAHRPRGVGCRDRGDREAFVDRTVGVELVGEAAEVVIADNVRDCRTLRGANRAIRVSDKSADISAAGF